MLSPKQVLQQYVIATIFLVFSLYFMHLGMIKVPFVTAMASLAMAANILRKIM
jgi:hypothetical protein